MVCDCWFPCSCVCWSLVKDRKIVWESQVIDSSSVTQSEALWVWRCDVTTSNSIQDILVFDLRVQLQHCTYQRKNLLFALINVSTFICKREISGLSSPLILLFWKLNRYIDYMRISYRSEGYGSVSLWRRANARNVSLYYRYWEFTNLFIFRFSKNATLTQGRIQRGASVARATVRFS